MQGYQSRAVQLTEALVRFPTVTPATISIFEYASEFLMQLGFRNKLTSQIDSNGDTIFNLYSEFGKGSPRFCYAGHFDVVPEGKITSWNTDPFTPTTIDGVLYGRGVVDMKGSIGAFFAALEEYLRTDYTSGTICLILTGDEEGLGSHGTKAVVEKLLDSGTEPFDGILLGEPTSTNRIADYIKVGRRGSISMTLDVVGKQGHVAYPEKATNPIPKLMRLVDHLQKIDLSEEVDDFQLSNLVVTNIDAYNQATNVIPEVAQAAFNIRFNPAYNVPKLINLVNRHLEKVDTNYQLTVLSGFEPFYCGDTKFVTTVKEAAQDALNITPQSSTAGGTSDGRFLHKLGPVVELGLNCETIHATNECSKVDDIGRLAKCYLYTLRHLFKK